MNERNKRRLPVIVLKRRTAILIAIAYCTCAIYLAVLLLQQVDFF